MKDDFATLGFCQRHFNSEKHKRSMIDIASYYLQK